MTNTNSITKGGWTQGPSVAPSVRFKTVLVVALAIAVVGGAVAFGGVVALDLQQDATQQDADGLTAGNESDRQQTSFVRVVHASPDAPAVDVTIDNETVLSGVEFGTVSDYLTVEAGTYNVTIASATDSDAIVFDEEVTFDPRSVTTVAASGEVSESAATAFEPIAFEDDGLTPAANESALRVVHLVPDAPAVDVTAANENVVLAENVSFRNASEYVSVPAGNYTVEIRAETEDNDGSILTTVDASLENGTAYSAFAVGYLLPDEAPADIPVEIVLSEDASQTVALPSDRATNDEGEDEGKTDHDTEDDAGDDAGDDDGADADDDATANGGGDSSDDADGSDDDSDSNGESTDESEDESDPGTDDGAESGDGDGDAASGDDSSSDDGTDDTTSEAGSETVDECRVIDEPGTFEVTQNLGSTNVQSIDIGNGIVRQTCLAIQSSDVVLDGGGFVVSGSGGDLSVGVHVYDPAGSTVENVTVRNLRVENWDNGVQVGVDTWAVNSAGPATARIENVQSIGNGHHGFFVVGAGTELSSVVANDNGASGIGVFDSGSVQVTGATTTGNAEHGVALLEEVFDSTVTDVTTTGNGGAEIYVGDLSSGNTFTDITFGSEGDSVEGIDGTDNTIDDRPANASETDDESDSDPSEDNGDESESEAADGNGTDSGNESETSDGDDGDNETDTDAGDGNETEAGNVTDTDAGGNGDADGGNQTGADGEADVDGGTGARNDTDTDDGSGAGNQTGSDSGPDAGTENDADGAGEGENGTDVEDGDGDGGGGVNEST